MNILVIEDNEHKRNKVCNFIKSLSFDVNLNEAASFNSGVKAVAKYDLDLIILDMSLPTHDKSATESGGRFRVYGGKDIIKKMIRKNIATPFVILTQYSSFGEGESKKNIRDLSNELDSLFDNQHISTIHYETSSSLWKEKLQQVINDQYDKITNS